MMSESKVNHVHMSYLVTPQYKRIIFHEERKLFKENLKSDL